MSICQDSADELGFDGIEVFQSNHEGAIVDRIQEAYGGVDGIVIIPAAYSQTSIAILDSLKAVGIPAVEVHISAVEKREAFRQISYAGMACFARVSGDHISAVEEREAFRQISYAGMACFARVSGEGLAGYAHALEILAEQLRTQD